MVLLCVSQEEIMVTTKTDESGPPRSIRFRPEDRRFVDRYQRKKGLSSFTEALRQMIRRVAEQEGWVRQ